MKSKKIGKDLMIIMLLLFDSILAFPFILIKILKKERVALYLAILFSVIAFYYTPFNKNSDIYRYFNFPLIAVRNQKDLYAVNVIKILLNNNISLRVLNSLSAFIMYFFFFLSIEKILKKEKYSSYNYFLQYLLFFTLLPRFGYTNIRFYPATAIFTYGLILNSENKIKNSYIFCLLATTIHRFYIFPFVILIAINMIKLNFNYQLKKKILFGLIILIVIFKIEISQVLLRKLMLYFKFSNGYIDGRWGVEYFKNMNLGGKITYIVSKTFYILWIYLYFKIKEIKKLDTYIFILAATCIFLSSFRTISERIFYSFFYFTIIELAEKKFIKKQIVKCLKILALIYSIMYIIILYKNYYLEILNMLENLYKMSILNIILTIK